MKSRKAYAVDISQSKIRLGKFRGTETDTLWVRHFGRTETDTAKWTHRSFSAKSKIQNSISYSTLT
ncbi:MAG: hypothetical protein HC903_13560 [Methylacidiphilales bacterium]|nr:hypothetical protein [Candidatus Methylacidiphilales bacterium]NJR15815.1 hypothetical protein [Calothrix sp. CSU_2_0]